MGQWYCHGDGIGALVLGRIDVKINIRFRCKGGGGRVMTKGGGTVVAVREECV